MTHLIKCTQPYFDQVRSGLKTFEYRRDDRNYQVGDTLILREYDPHLECYCRRKCVVVIMYKLCDSFLNMTKGYCILGIRRKLETPSARAEKE